MSNKTTKLCEMYEVNSSKCGIRNGEICEQSGILRTAGCGYLNGYHQMIQGIADGRFNLPNKLELTSQPAQQ